MEEVPSMVQMTSYEPRESTSRTVCVSPDKTRMKGQAIKWTTGQAKSKSLCIQPEQILWGNEGRALHPLTSCSEAWGKLESTPNSWLLALIQEESFLANVH